MATLKGSEFRHGQLQHTGVLVCNLGTPAAPTPGAVRRYLAEFLSDPRVVELPRWLWLPILHGVILNIRPRRSAHAYQKVWQASGSPLLTGSQAVVEGLKARFDTSAAPRFALAMRYGKPSIADGLNELLEAGVTRLLVLPLYPQYASATTASVFDSVFDELRTLRWQPALRTVADYHNDSAYIAALAQSVREYRAEHGAGEQLMMSFHGIPHDSFIAGDPYFCQCQATGRLLAEALQLPAQDWTLTFQSRVGPKRWLEPYTAETLKQWGADGRGDIDVICPGFAVDCLETLEEIALQNADIYRAAGGGALRYIPCLNERDAHIDMLAALVRRESGEWLTDTPRPAASRRAVADRARDLGAPEERIDPST